VPLGLKAFRPSAVVRIRDSSLLAFRRGVDGADEVVVTT